MDHKVVRKNDGERLLAHCLLAAKHGVTQAKLLFLDGVAEAQDIAEGAEFIGYGAKAFVVHHLLDSGFRLEVLLQRLFAPSGDNDYVLYAGSHGLAHGVVNNGPIIGRDKLLGHGLGKRQEPRPQPCGGYDDRTDGWCRGHEGILHKTDR